MSSRSRPDPFWLCHECGAQMRPIRVDGVPHCASCNGEFIEILDPDVNPDLRHDLPPPPPTRPQTSPAPSQPGRSTSPSAPDSGAPGGFMQSLFSGLFGAAVEESGSGSSSLDRSRTTETALGQGSSPSRGHQGEQGGRDFSFTLPGGGQGRIMFGGIGGQMGGTGGMGPFGPLGRNQNQGLEAFFPGFAPPRGQGIQQDLTGQNLLRALMTAVYEEGAMQHPLFGGTQGRMNTGDYVMTQQGFDQVLEQLMQAAGPQGPLPASDVVIEGLPRFTFDAKSLAASPFKDCPVCKEDFAVGDEVMRIPCKHIFHPDCIQPWLRVNGSCPVCRFSLVPEGGNRPSAPAPAPTGNDGQSTITNILNRLWGQSGTTSGPTSPATEDPPRIQPMAGPSPPHSAPVTQTPLPTSLHTSTSEQPATNDISDQTLPDLPERPPPGNGPTLSSAIPEDYRARHRERERERQNPYGDDLD